MSITSSQISSFILAIAIAFSASSVFAGLTGEIKGSNVNLRAAPNLKAEVVGQVNSGDKLIVSGESVDGWVRVVPPDEVSLWIATRLLDGDKVRVDHARVRAGASLNYHDVGILNRGETVSIRGTMGDWTKIAPFPSAGVWITNKYITVGGEPAFVTSAKPAKILPAKSEPKLSVRAPNKTVVVSQKAADTSAAESVTSRHDSQTNVRGLTYPSFSAKPKHSRRTLFGNRSAVGRLVGPDKVPVSKLKDVPQQGEHGVFTGRLEIAPHGSPARFMLVNKTAAGVFQTECFVVGNGGQLSGLVESLCKFEGSVYKFRGTDTPVLFVKNIFVISGRKK